MWLEGTFARIADAFLLPSQLQVCAGASWAPVAGTWSKNFNGQILSGESGEISTTILFVELEQSLGPSLSLFFTSSIFFSAFQAAWSDTNTSTERHRLMLIALSLQQVRFNCCDAHACGFTWT